MAIPEDVLRVSGRGLQYLGMPSQGEIGAKKRLVPQSGPVAKQRYCFPFNNKGACDRGGTCQFWHRCLKCGGDHPQVYCEKRKRK